MKIVYVGELQRGATCGMRRDALIELGHEVRAVNTTDILTKTRRIPGVWRLMPRLDPAFRRINRELEVAVQQTQPDIVWIDKGIHLFPETIRDLKKSFAATWVHYNPDDPFGELRARWWALFIAGIPLYDVHFVPRPQNVPEYKALGCKNVHEFDRGFNRNLHRPLELSHGDLSKYGTPVGFVGSWASARASSLAFLADQGIPVTVRGDYWQGREHWPRLAARYRGAAVLGEDYIKAMRGMDIALHFLRHENRDAQDSRTFEIPACAVFMLAERSGKHLDLFEEGKEAEFFSSDEELLDKTRYYLVHPEARKRIAIAGRERCLRSGYSYHDRLAKMIALVRELR